METLTLFLLFVGFSVGQISVEEVKAKCPADYRRRVETCIMDAQLAPQAGGGITLVLNKDTIVNLCDRGILRKTIDCMKEIHTRCAHNSTVVQELDRLYSVPRWEEGAKLICEDTELFQSSFDCLHQSATSVTSCVLMRTHTFRMGLAFTDPTDHASVKDVTCSFAESIVKCLCSPLERHCPKDLMMRVAGGMRLFLPPLCIDYHNHDYTSHDDDVSDSNSRDRTSHDDDVSDDNSDDRISHDDGVGDDNSTDTTTAQLLSNETAAVESER